MDDYLGAVVSEQQVKKAYFRDKEFELKKGKVGKYEISAVVLWILCFGVCFATSSSYAIKVNGKSISVGESKRKKKKNKKNK